MISEIIAQPGSTADPYSDYTENRLFEKIDNEFLRVCKQCFIAGMALRSGPADKAIEKFDGYQAALHNYTMLVLEELYLPLEQQLDRDAKPAEFAYLIAQNSVLNKRLRKFINHSNARIENHRVIFSNAIMRIDKILTNHHIKERSVLYPLHSALNSI